MEDAQAEYVAFEGDRLVLRGGAAAVAELAWRAHADGRRLLILDLATGGLTDFDLRGGLEEIRARYQTAEAPRRPGRPKLGVVAREVTLLPRHWDWLNAQPGGASVALRKLVEQARKADAGSQRAATSAAYAFMQAMAGDRANFEEAARALFAHDARRFAELTRDWPRDVASVLNEIAAPALEPGR